MTDKPRAPFTRTSRFIAASPEALYAAFVDPSQLIGWLPPDNMTARIHAFDARVGGGYEMSLFYPRDEAEQGKTVEGEDRVRIRFVALEPPRQLVEAIVFVTDDPALTGEMTMTATFEPANGGTIVTMLFEELPPGLKPADNDAGAALSLAQLAARFDAASAS